MKKLSEQQIGLVSFAESGSTVYSEKVAIKAVICQLCKTILLNPALKVFAIPNKFRRSLTCTRNNKGPRI